MKTSLAAAAGTIAAATVIAGCTSSGGTPTQSGVIVSTAHAQTSGTETITGQVTGAAALGSSGSITFPLILTGPVNTTGTITLLNNSDQNIFTFKTKAGDIVIATSPDVNAAKSPTVLNATTCRLRYTAHSAFTVIGGKSTGAFKDAHGSGKITSPLEANAPKLANGQCDMSNSDPLLAAGAVNTFHSVGPLTVY